MGLNNVFFDPDRPTGQKFLSQAVRDEIAAVVPLNIDPGAIQGDMLADGAVGTDELANGAVTGAKVEAESLVGGNLAEGTITGDKIADGTIGAAQCGPGVMSVTDINGNDITFKAVKCSSSDFTALATKDPNTLYIVTS